MRDGSGLGAAFLNLALSVSVVAHSQQAPGAASQLTPQEIQRINGRGFPGSDAGLIPRLLAGTTGDLVIRDVYSAFEIGIMPADPSGQIASLTCYSKLVVVGQVTAQSSHMTANQGSVYTELTVAINEVIKQNLRARATAGGAITVLKPGGDIQIAGRKVSASRRGLRDVETGRDYLLSLNGYIAETGAYTTTAIGFDLSNATVRGLDERGYFKDLEAMSRLTFLQVVRSTMARLAAAGHCQGGGIQ